MNRLRLQITKRDKYLQLSGIMHFASHQQTIFISLPSPSPSEFPFALCSMGLAPYQSTNMGALEVMNYASTLGQCQWTLPFGLGWVRPHHLTHKPLRTFGGAPLPPSRNLLSLYQELGPSRHFPLAVGARIPQQLQTFITSTCDI